MALIKCPECGKELSSLAKCCPNCGCPVAEMSSSGSVKIKLPNIELGTVGLFSSRDASIRTSSGRTLWRGQHGQTAIFDVDGETSIVINLGRWANETTGNVYPRRKYTLIQDLGIHWLATYRLSEVDVIDSD